MAKSSLTLTHTDINSGNPVKILCNSIRISGKKNNNKDPNVNSTAHVEVQTQSFENLNYTCNGVNITNESGTLTWNDILILYKIKYDGTNYATLNITYDTDKTITGLGGSTDIKVVLETPTNNISMRETRDGYIPQVSLVFNETA